ncbi:MAG: glycosyltransferase family 2 protein, partial [Campylobacterales bacterium]
MNSVSVSIIIPVYGNEKLVHNLLETLIPSLEQYLYEIIVIDDGYEDMKIDHKKLPHKVKYLSNDTNLGYAKSVNKAIKIAKYEYIALINSDILVDREWLTEGIKVFYDYEDVGIVGGTLIYPDYGTIQHAGAYFTKGKNFLAFRMSSVDSQDFSNCVEFPQAVVDSVAITKKEYLFRVGLYDENYHMGSDDIDLCFKLREIGLRSAYAPRMIAYHKVAASKENRYKYHSEDKRYFINKWKGKIDDDTEKIFEKSLDKFKLSENG